MIAFENSKNRVGVYPRADSVELVIGWDEMNVPLTMRTHEAKLLVEVLTKALAQIGHPINNN